MRSRSLAVAITATLLALLLAAGWAMPGSSTAIPAVAAYTPRLLQGELVLTATVGLADDQCASTDRIYVGPNTTIYYCYQIKNLSANTYNIHRLTDNGRDIFGGDESFPLLPGETVSNITRGRLVSSIPLNSEVHTVTWTAKITEADTNPAVAVDSTYVSVVNPTTFITKTVGLEPNFCATTSSLVAPPNATVYYCLTVYNSTEITFSDYVIDDPALTLKFSFPRAGEQLLLPPGERLVITNSVLTNLGASPLFRKSNVTANITNTLAFTASSPTTGIAIRDDATAVVTLGRVAVNASKTVGESATTCATTKTLAVPSGSTVYYCLTVQNSGNFLLTRHTIADPTLGLTHTFTRELAAGATLALTQDELVKLGGPAALLRRENVTTGITNTLFYTATGPFGVATTAQPQSSVTIGQSALVVTKTVGLNPSACASSSTLGVPSGSTIYYCFTIQNLGNLPFVQFTLNDPQLGVNGTFQRILQPAERLVITNDVLNTLIPGSTQRLTAANVTQPVTNTLTVTAATSAGEISTKSSRAVVSIGSPAIGIAKYISTDATNCPATASVTVSAGTQIYYCLRLENRGAATLTDHRFVDPATNVTTAFSYTLTPGAVLTVTNNLLTTALKSTAGLGPFSVNANLNSLVNFTSRNVEGQQTTASASAVLNLIVLTPTPTLSPTPSLTPVPVATSTPTFTPFPTLSPTPLFTFTPVGTPTPVIVSLLPTPTFTRDFLANNITTPVGGVQGNQPQSPLGIPPTPFVNSPLPTPPLDPFYVAATQTAMAAATETGIALAFPPTPAATETPSPTATETPSPTATPTPTPTATATMRPVEAAALPAAPMTTFPLFTQVLDAAVAAAGWIWFLCGSLIFFVTAGILAGLGFRRQERRRYALVDAEIDEDTYEIDTTLTSLRPGPAADDNWPASLP